MTLWLVKTKNFLLYLFLFLLPWQTRLILRAGELNGGYWEYGTKSLYAVEILLWTVVLFTIIEMIVKKFSILNFQFSNEFKIKNLKLKITIKNSKSFLLAGFLLLIGFISAFHALSPSLAFYWLWHFIEGAAIFLIILTSNVNFKKISLAFIGGAVLQAGLGIWQFFAQNVFASKWLGMAAQIPSTLGVSVVEGGGMRFLRAYGALPHPNILGVYLVLAIVLLLWITLCHRERSVAIPFLTGLLRPIGVLAMTLMLITGLFFTFSRAAWLVLIIVLLFYFLMRFKFLSLRAPPNAGRGNPMVNNQRDCFAIARNDIFLFVFYFILLLLFFWPLASARVSSLERLEVKSTAERLSGYQEAWQIIKTNPWLGVGPGNYTLAVHNEINATQPSWAYQPAHNVFLLALSEIGIFGFMAFVVMLLILLKNIWQKACGRFYTVVQNLPQAFAPVVLFFVLMFFFIFDHFLWSLPLGIWLFWCIIGLTLKLQENRNC